MSGACFLCLEEQNSGLALGMLLPKYTVTIPQHPCHASISQVPNCEAI